MMEQTTQRLVLSVFDTVRPLLSGTLQSGRLMDGGRLRSFHRFAVRSSSAHEGKIIIFERFQCFLTKTIQLN